MQSPTQTDPAEGPRDDDASASKSGGQGVSATDPAEGADDAPPEGEGSPMG